MSTTMKRAGWIASRQRDDRQSLQGLYVHVATYAIVNSLISLIDLFTPGGPWFFYPLLGWGCVVVMHAEAIFFSRQVPRLAWTNRSVAGGTRAVHAAADGLRRSESPPIAR